MIDSYWDLYLAYIRQCETCNKEHDIDPHHYEMEWNHLLPQGVFGELPFGQWLTLKQHAIASALQTVALKYRCMFGTHIAHLPDWLWDLAKPYYNAGSLLGARITMERKLGIFDPKNKAAVEAVNIRNWTRAQRSEYAKRAHETKGPEVRSSISSNAAKSFWNEVTLEELAIRNEKISGGNKKHWGAMTAEDKANRLEPARKSLMKPVRVIFNEGSEKIYDSLTDAAISLGLTRRTVAKMAKRKKSNSKRKLGIKEVILLNKEFSEAT